MKQREQSEGGREAGRREVTETWQAMGKIMVLKPRNEASFFFTVRKRR